MYVWSLTLIIFLAGCSPIHFDKECRIARMKIELYEGCASDEDCRMTSGDRKQLVYAKSDEIRFCPNEGRRLKDTYLN